MQHQAALLKKVMSLKLLLSCPVSYTHLLPLGPVVMMDTPGIDDEGELGELRVKKSYQAVSYTHLNMEMSVV